MREVDDHVLGPPGEITQAIQSRFFEAIQGKRQEYLEWLDFVELDVPATVEAGAPSREPRRWHPKVECLLQPRQ